MKVHLIVEEYEENPEYKPGKFIEYDGRYGPPVVPEQFINRRRLDVALTEEEWKAIKKAVLGVM